MIQNNRISTTTSDVNIRNTIFSNFNNKDTNGGGAVFISGSTLNFECYGCVLKSCYSVGYGGGVHANNILSSNVFAMCGYNCTASSAGQLLRSVATTGYNNNAAFVSMTKCGPKSAPGSVGSIITSHGKYTMHDINGSDCHITGNCIIAPHDSTGNGYIKYITIAKSSASIASRIHESTVTVSHYNVIDNEITTAIFETYETPKCENSVFKNNHCTTLVSGVNTIFNNCYFDKQMSGSFTTNNCNIGNIAYTLVKMNNEYIPRCFSIVKCTYHKTRTTTIGNFIYYIIMVIS